MPHRTLVVSGAIGDGGLQSFHKVIASGRARQVLRVRGYRLGAGIAGTLSTDQFAAFQLVLSVEGLAPAKTSELPLPAAARGVRDMRRTGVFDIWKMHRRMDTGAGISVEVFDQSEWVNCDIEMPALWLHSSVQASSQAGDWEAWAIVEYEWVDKTPGGIAALQLLWGLDGNDSDASSPDQT